MRAIKLPLCLLPSAIVSLMLSIHFLRLSDYGWAVLCLLFFTLLLFSRKRWVWIIFQGFLLAGILVWVYNGTETIAQQVSMGEPWGRTAVMMSMVCVLSVLAWLFLRVREVRAHYDGSAENTVTSTVAFFLTFLICSFPQALMHDPVPLMAERFIKGGGWIEIFFLSLYSAWLVEKIIISDKPGKIRGRIWTAFSVVFFLQAALGISGFEKFLMTGSLHLPVPALIVAGPLYRGEGFFMSLLLLSTLILVGPVWCSWICYIGNWDFLASRSRRKPAELPGYYNHIRISLFAALVIVTLFLRFSGFSTSFAVICGAAFGLCGVAVMIRISRKKGIMVHCTTYCPTGLINNLVGKINPFRIRIGNGCIDCFSCMRACRYGALTKISIRKRRPGLTCTLCGDCAAACKDSRIGYHFPGISSVAARKAFLTLVVVLHAVFLGMARI
ncbi:MAG: 4Fe-4S binding protein [Fibrobacter sp.]|nr:4Fe-4S binding protein [Fibrobacter sp.]